MIETMIPILRSWLKEKGRRKHTRGRIVDAPKGFNEILYSEFKRLVGPGAEPEEIDIIIEQMQSKGFITKVEGVIIHLSIDKLLRDPHIIKIYGR